ncbi:hypothetical protein N7466_008300 [Penicillium verhagenii]|uniref:uncharacterized protein n=1 Tax=Penicillium verhagenii TaxID=1562060 RepID=UPI00254526A9|nr:uncharacterized protein N7466_008300 [Penicillium verhagenii]KAJ5924113.1 hypothetical protein N7466_008300 [Penicillium verhagenii]
MAPGVLSQPVPGQRFQPLDMSEQCTLPPGRVFPIKIGSGLFRLSGASIASDAPSYFSRFFESQVQAAGSNANATQLRTLYIDRDPETFKLIANHLQGYFIQPKNGEEFVRLFADAQFYNLPRLMAQLFDCDIFVKIGDRDFQIPRAVLTNPGNDKNYFTLGFSAFFASPSHVFPGLNRAGLLRPPSILPPSVPGRSADVFAQLLHGLRGYAIEIKNEEHRQELLSDCRYYHFAGVEQKLIAHKLTYNSVSEHEEITLRLEDIRPSGISFDQTTSHIIDAQRANFVYSRPHADQEMFRDLVVEFRENFSFITAARDHLDFQGDARLRMESLIKVTAEKLDVDRSLFTGLPLKIRWTRDADIIIDGKRDPQALCHLVSVNEYGNPGPLRKRRRVGEPDDVELPHGDVNTDRNVKPQIDEDTDSDRFPSSLPPSQPSRPCVEDPDDTELRWVVGKGQWRLLVQHTLGADRPWEILLTPVKLQIYTDTRACNVDRDFL